MLGLLGDCYMVKPAAFEGYVEVVKAIGPARRGPKRHEGGA